MAPQNGNVLTITTPEGTTSGPVEAGISYDHMVRAFVDHLVLGAPFPTQGQDSINNMAAIDAWSSVFRGHLGIALTDTYTTDLFLKSFDSVEARVFDGVRQDSGDPYVFVDKLVAHYQKLRINPLTKTIVFSDDLDTKIAISIKEYCRGKINASFGIGTNLSNDLGVQPLNIVIKLSQCRSQADTVWIPMVKLSDTEGKHTGDADEIELCLRIVQRSSL